MKILPFIESQEIGNRFQQNDNIHHHIETMIKEGMSILVSSNSSKKILKKVGFDPRKIIVSGGPLILQDYYQINPNLDDAALNGIKRRCESVQDELNRAISEWNKVVFILEKDNHADIIIKKELKSLKLNVEMIQIESWKNAFEDQTSS
jgi:hypothetical protein